MVSELLFICLLVIWISSYKGPVLVFSVQFSRSVVSDSLRPYELQHARPPCLSPTSGVYPKLMSIESVVPSSHLILCRPLLYPPSIFPSIRIFSNESVLRIRWPRIEVSASASVFLMHIQDWFPLGWTGLIPLLSKRLLRVFHSAIQKHQFFTAQPFLWSSSHIHTWLLEQPQLWLDGSLLTTQYITWKINI